MRKLLSKPAGSSFDTTLSDSSNAPIPLLYQPNGPQEAEYQAGVPIAALDKSPDGHSAVLASRHVLKTVRLDGLDIRDTFDLRALILAQSSVSIVYQLSIRDVKWGTGRNDTSIYTACLTGNIFQYDLARLGARVYGGGTPTVDFVQTQEDARQINTLDINPHKNAYLLSGSQDGVVRCFDTRTLVPSRYGPTFRAMQAFKCNGDVRHVQWSPKQGFYFACCTEQGVIMKWDIRKASAPVLRIAGHEKACSSLSWHPDGEHLISGGVDKKCHVWDMSKDGYKRQKPKWSIHTPASVAVVAWRRGQWSATCQGLRAAQVAVSYDVSGPKKAGINAVHIWDLARPTMPYKTIERFSSSPSAMLWKDQEFLWTAGEDGLFCQNDVAFSPRSIDRIPVSTLSFSSCGDVLSFVDDRPPPPRRPRVLASVHKDLSSATAAAAAAVSSSSYGSDPSTPTLIMSRSDSEDDVVHGFLKPRRRVGFRKRRASSVQPLSATPPSESPAGSNSLDITLDQALQASLMFRPQQTMAIGHVPSAAHKATYGYLARQYLHVLEDTLPAFVGEGGMVVPLPDRVATILDSYARAAENVSQFRLAQVWRILAFAMDLLFQKRAQYHQEKRSELVQRQPASDVLKQPSRDRDQENDILYGNSFSTTLESESTNGEDTSFPGDSPQTSRARPVRSLLTEEIESTSNVPTPLVRPVPNRAYMGESLRGYGSGFDNVRHPSYDASDGLDMHADVDDFRLPPAKYHQNQLSQQPRRRHLNSIPISETSHDSGATQLSSMEGYDFYDTEAIVHAIDVPGATSRPSIAASAVPFSGTQDSQNSPLSPPRAQFYRQDSSESAAGRIFDISQASGNDLEPPDGRVAGVSRYGAGSQRDRNPLQTTVGRSKSHDNLQRVLERRETYQSSGRGRHDEKLGSSVGSSRLVRLNRALLSLDWSGSDLTATLPGITKDTYYRTTSQDTASSTTSYHQGSPFAEDAPARGSRKKSVSSKRPALHRDASSRLEASVIHSSRPEMPADGGTLPNRVTDRDYLPWQHDPPYPFTAQEDETSSGLAASAALNPYVILSRALSFETRTSPLNASAMVLLLQPLVPKDVIDPLQAKAILQQHHSRLMRMQLFLEAALLRKLCVQGWPGGADLSTWGATYPAIIAPANQGVSASYLCSQCKKPLEKPESGGDPTTAANAQSPFWQCERCRAVMAPCAVCGHRDLSMSPPQSHEDELGPRRHGYSSPSSAASPVLSTWWYCAGCGHGGHLTCIEGWHASAAERFFVADGESSPVLGSPTAHGHDSPIDNNFDNLREGRELSDGCCPLDGCGHECLPMPKRTDLATARGEEPAPAVLDASGAGSKASPLPLMSDSAAERDQALEREQQDQDDRERNQEYHYDLNGYSNSGGSGSGAGNGPGESGELSGELSVRADGHEAKQSRAVDVVRESLVFGGDAERMLSASPTRIPLGESRERERRKSVKFARPEDRSRSGSTVP
ncbi:WD repeat protein [Niveomyces insectorum RCEF 264]|uniref:WD repeat protein n=1 Tax=Niveomyces insectorum RCEF 264 TaxID=1081102 RepID=A0A167N843_9HYPO|nr:WD repeat protein [Niveomyces insectorum RCEF 264]